jgi:hypothetical protein
MTAPRPDDPGPELPAEPTIRAARPPVPGRPAPRVHPDDEPTVGLPGQAPKIRQRTLQFGTPAPVRVTVTARPRRRRRFRTWPWIVVVVLALLVLGAVLTVMLLRGATIDGDVDLVGSGGSGRPVSTAPVVGSSGVD